MLQSGTGVSVEAIDHVFQTNMLDMLNSSSRLAGVKIGKTRLTGNHGGDWGEVSSGDGGGSEPLGGVLSHLHCHLQQGPHELPRLHLCHYFDKLASPGYILFSS